MYPLNVARLVRRVSAVVGGPVTCDVPAAPGGRALVATPLALVLRRGADVYRVEVAWRAGRVLVGEGEGTGRFAAAARELRRVIVEVAGDAKPVPAGQPTGR